MKTRLLLLTLLLLIGCDDITDDDSTGWQQTWHRAVTQFIDPNSAEKDVWFTQIWQQITPLLDKLLTLEQQHDTLPESTWFGQDKIDNENEMNRLLDEAVAILSLSNSSQTRAEILQLEQQIHEAKQHIDRYRQAQVAAPQESTWETTVADYDDKIKQRQRQIRSYQQRIAQRKTEFAQQLAKKDLQITPKQLDLLLSSVVGDDIIQMNIIYDNVRQISQQLMHLTQSSQEDFAISQRYYGIYTVLLKILLHMQRKFIAAIDEHYLPKIEQITAEVQALTTTTKQLLGQEDNESRRQHLLTNLEAQNLTLQTAVLYQQHLITQRSKMATARDKIAADLEIAQNTYKTVVVSRELIQLLRTSQHSFELLLNIQTPELLIFENLKMKQEFAVLSKKLAQ
ncbi:MAG: hypothetical protein SVR94_06410 [Pseudomonadota bacterium]|nr:hypothetical protein [Pseudomonadota bacterium]